MGHRSLPLIIFKRSIAYLFFGSLAVLGSSAVFAQAVSFSVSDLQGASPTNPTSLQFGPDGRLYVSQQDGSLQIYSVVRNGANDYQVTGTETIDLIKNIANHGDDGSLNPSENTRQVTGILVTGTSTNPVIYVSSSDPRIGAGPGSNDLGLDTNSGIISRLTWNGSSWEKVDLIRGLPRSEENHATNGMQLDEIKNILYVAQGGHTNAGAPSNNFAFSTEYALSGAILSIDLDAIEASGLPYDLPTLDDPTRSGNPDANDPFGGNDGLNQAKLVDGGPVQVYAGGFRNPYDLVITQSGEMYSIDNGPNGGWGGWPDNEGPGGNCTNDYIEGEPGFVNNLDNLHLIEGPGDYAGHPAPVRGNFNAGLGRYDNNSGLFIFDPNPTSDWPPVPLTLIDPIECDFQQPGVDDDALTTWSASTNGLTEYTAGNFDGALQGDLLAAGFDNTVQRIILDPVSGTASSEIIAANFGNLPLDVTAQGDFDPFPGTFWVAVYGATKIAVFEPGDFDGGVPDCTGADDPSLDEDGDGFNNTDEIDNGTNPCSSASQPPDADGDFVSDLNDTDDDNDGVIDTEDPFVLDSQNGATTSIPLRYDLFNCCPGTGFFGVGFTGLMVNGDDYLMLFDQSDLVVGGTAGLFTNPNVGTGTALESANTQRNALQFGVNVDSTTGPYTVGASVVATFFKNEPQANQSQGLYIGNGDQDNYLEISLNANDGNGGIKVLQEVGGTVVNDTLFDATNTSSLSELLDSSSIQLFLQVDPASGTAQPQYSTDGGIVTDLGSPIALSGAALDAVQNSSSPLAIGFIATAGAGPNFTATWDWVEVTLPGSPATQIRLNAGGGSYTDSAGNTWEADFGFNTGNTFSTTSAIASTGDDTLYQSERYDLDVAPELQYAFAVPDGDYFVNLYFAEIFSGAFSTGARVFDVAVEGALVLDNLDIFSEAGAEAALVKSFTVTVSDGQLDIEFLHQVENPKISAIEIISLATATPEPNIAVSPTTLNFGSVELGNTSQLDVTLSNSGDDDLEVTDLTLTGDAAFTLVSSPVVPFTLAPGATQAVTVEFAPTVEGTVNADLEITSDDPDEGLATVDLTGTGTSGTASTQIRLNAGGGSYTDSAGNTWEADFGFNTGNTFSTTSAIASTGDDTLYQSERYDLDVAPELQYAFAVPDGDYFVNLYFAEIFSGAFSTGARVFDVAVEGALVLDNLDIFSEAGAEAALVKSFTVTVSDGQLDIEFLHQVENPKISAIEIISLATATPEPNIAVSPTTLNFGSVELGNTSQLDVTLSNSGDDDLEVTDLTLTGDAAFTLVSSPVVPFTLAPGATQAVTVEFAPTVEGTVNADLEITSDDPDEGLATVDLTGTGTSGTASTQIRLNAGGGSYTDSAGNTWEADFGFNTGNTFSTTSAIASTGDDTLYQSERYDLDVAPELQYAFAVPDGDYFVNLYFAEIFSGAFSTGARVFDVAVEGALVLDNLDIFSEAGAEAALVKSFTVTVSDGQLDIEFLHQVENPKISAIEILSQ